MTKSKIITVSDRKYIKVNPDWWVAVDDISTIGPGRFVTKYGESFIHTYGTPDQFLTSLGGTEVLHG